MAFRQTLPTSQGFGRQPSYRCAWAERAAVAGYPERWARAAQGHKSRAVHLAYAKKARVVCPPLETYRINEAQTA